VLLRVHLLEFRILPPGQPVDAQREYPPAEGGISESHPSLGSEVGRACDLETDIEADANAVSTSIE